VSRHATKNVNALVGDGRDEMIRDESDAKDEDKMASHGDFAEINLAALLRKSPTIILFAGNSYLHTMSNSMYKALGCMLYDELCL
jgi:hypothetical protein